MDLKTCQAKETLENVYSPFQGSALTIELTQERQWVKGKEGNREHLRQPGLSQEYLKGVNL